MSDDIANLIGAALVDPAVAERLAADTKLKAPGALASVLRAIRILIREGLPLEILRVGEKMAADELAAVGGLSGLSALVVDANLDAARRLVGLDATEQQPNNLSEKSSRPLFVSAASFFDGALVIDYLVKKLLERGTTGEWFGPWGQGKSFLADDLAVSVATGGEFAGHQCERGIVLIFAGEGHVGKRRRIKAIAKQRGLKPEDLRLLHISATPIFFNGSNLSLVIREAQQLEEHLGSKISLIIIDTMARHMAGDENSNRDAGEFIRAVDQLREAFPGSVALIIHHSGNGEDTKDRGRGASCVPGAMDFIAKIDKGALTFLKMKEAELPPPIEFKLVPVEIGTDEDGTPITSCVVEFGERAAKHRPQLTSNEQVVVNALERSEAPVNKSVLRHEFYAERRAQDPDIKTNTVKNAWLAALKTLTAKKIIAQTGDLIGLNVSNRQSASETVIYDGSDGERDRQKRHLSLKGDDDLTPPTDAPLTLPFADLELPGVTL